MNISLIFKAFAIVLTVALLQLADTSESKAWGGNCSGGSGTQYVVCYGDTLFSIGRKFNVNPYCVSEANGLWNPDYIYAGQVLYIPQNCSPYPYPRNQYPYNNNSWNPSNNGCGGYNWNGSYYNNCYRQGAGYDYTGYYYDSYSPNYQRYSYTCGYYNNCY